MISQPTPSDLGQITKFTSTQSTPTPSAKPSHRHQYHEHINHPHNRKLQLRYQLLYTAGKLLPKSRTATCMQRVIPNTTGVNIIHQQGEPHARVRNVWRCGNGWICPFCASIISQRRREELTRALTQSGYYVVMTTFTLHHHSGQRLVEVLGHIQNVYDSFTGGRAYQKFKHEFHVIGTITSKEILDNPQSGWHPHLHVLFILKAKPADLDTLAAAINQHWLTATKKRKLYAHPDHATKITAQNDYLPGYITKHGQLTGQSQSDIITDLAGTAHNSNREGNLTPFELLALAATGNAQAAKRFVEYAEATKGKQMIRYSRNLKQLLGIDQQSDQQVAQQANDQPSLTERLIVTLPPDQWKNICRARQQARVLIYAVHLKPADFQHYLEQFKPQPGKQGKPQPSP